MDDHSRNFVCLAGEPLLIIKGLDNIIFSQSDGEIIDIFVFDAMARCDNMLTINQNSSALKHTKYKMDTKATRLP